MLKDSNSDIDGMPDGILPLPHIAIALNSQVLAITASEEHVVSEPLRPEHFAGYEELPPGEYLDKPE